MVTISLCMIVKDEEALLPRCLESIQGLVEEVIVVDTGSSDRTVELAQQAGAQVYHFPWVGDFSQARNFSFSKATQQYCLWMDADDVLDAQYRPGFLQLKAALPPQTDVVMLPYHTAFDQAGAPTFTYYRERLIRRLAGLRWSGAVHEAIPPVGNVVYWDKAAISHRKPGPGDPDRNLGIYQGLLAQGKTLSPRERFYYARELASHGREEEAAAQWEEYLASGEGWVENQREACRDLSACYLRQGKGEEAFRALAKALRLGPPGRSSAAISAPFSWSGGTIPPRLSGMRRPSPGPGRTAREPLSPQTATATCPASSCACAITAWGTWSAPGSTTAGRASISPKTRPFSTTSGFSRGWGRPIHKRPLWMGELCRMAAGKVFPSWGPAPLFFAGKCATMNRYTATAGRREGR